MTAPITTVRDYSLALFGALCAAGIEPKQAGDCANNAAGPIASLPEYTVAEVIVSSLLTQRGVGFATSDEQIARAADACARLPRFSVPVDDADVRVRETLPALPDAWGSRATDAKDPNYGRACVCGAPIRAGERYSHACSLDTRHALPDRGDELEPAVGDYVRVDSDRSPKSADVGMAPVPHAEICATRDHAPFDGACDCGAS